MPKFRGLTRRQKWIGGTSAAVLAAAAGLTAAWEGERTRPYLDTGGVWTVCIGETQVDMRAYTVAECRAMFAQRLRDYDNGMKACLTRAIPDSVHVAFISVTYNIGVEAFCKSSMARHANAGDFGRACDSLMLWVNDNGRFVQGLANRREAERRFCHRDLR